MKTCLQPPRSHFLFVQTTHTKCYAQQCQHAYLSKERAVPLACFPSFLGVEAAFDLKQVCTLLTASLGYEHVTSSHMCFCLPSLAICKGSPWPSHDGMRQEFSISLPQSLPATPSFSLRYDKRLVWDSFAWAEHMSKIVKRCHLDMYCKTAAKLPCLFGQVTQEDAQLQG